MKYKSFTIVIPAYNEAKTLPHVVTEALKTPYVERVIVVDDGSSDDTIARLKPFKTSTQFQVVRHEKNKGKGQALKTGLAHIDTEVVLFLDADLRNITAEKIARIAKPVLENAVDLSRASFRLARGRVTEFAVKPMMSILFPDQHFDQPITGQVCGKKSFFETLSLETRWGVDIGILLDAIEAGQRIQEIDIGELEHKARTAGEKAEMARQVLETMIKKAGLIQHKYRLVIFTLDSTLVDRDVGEAVFEQVGKRRELQRLKRQLRSGKLTFSQFVRRTARLLGGVSQAAVEAAALQIPLTPYALEVVRSLKQRKFNVALMSSNFSPVVKVLAQRLGIEQVATIGLEQQTGVFTGALKPMARGQWYRDDLSDALLSAVRRLARRAKVRLKDTVVVANSPKVIPILGKVGLSLAYRPTSKELRREADKTISVLAEILALVE
ncbi:HAD-IB family phosphatase [Candidatus Berkelbacteria bacterium]|nr:HAD-IB family phosphatase [Candidatus Berkelbacteria bacterium]